MNDRLHMCSSVPEGSWSRHMELMERLLIWVERWVCVRSPNDVGTLVTATVVAPLPCPPTFNPDTELLSSILWLSNLFTYLFFSLFSVCARTYKQKPRYSNVFTFHWIQWQVCTFMSKRQNIQQLQWKERIKEARGGGENIFRNWW